MESNTSVMSLKRNIDKAFTTFLKTLSANKILLPLLPNLTGFLTRFLVGFVSCKAQKEQQGAGKR
jgi:hypothetical protein